MELQQCIDKSEGKDVTNGLEAAQPSEPGRSLNS